MKAKATNHCRWCGARLTFNFALAALSLSESLRIFLEHARVCEKFPPRRRATWEAHARWILAKVNRAVS